MECVVNVAAAAVTRGGRYSFRKVVGPAFREIDRVDRVGDASRLEPPAVEPNRPPAVHHTDHDFNAANNGGFHMLGWAIFFLLVAVVAGALGFGGVAAVSAEAAQLIFWVFIVLFVVAVLYHLFTGRRPPAV